MLLPLNKYPEFLKPFKDAIRGVQVGECVETGKPLDLDEFGHAHIGLAYQGHICVSSKYYLRSKAVILHEVAHVLTLEVHTDRWRRTLLEIGGSLDEQVVHRNGSGAKMLASYKKKKRKT